MDPRQSVRPGDPIRLAAEQVNGLNKLLGARGGFGGPAGEEYARPYSWVYYKNGEDVYSEDNFNYQTSYVVRGQCVQLANLLLPPQQPQGYFGQRLYEREYDVPVFTEGDPRGYATGNSKVLGAWGVAVEPIRHGRIGRVAVDGVVQARVNILDTSHRFVAFPGVTAPVGDALILWQEAGVGELKWVVMRLGHDRGCVQIRFTAPWAKGTARSVEDPATANPTRTIANVLNLFGTVGGSGVRAGAIAWLNNRWVLIAAEC